MKISVAIAACRGGRFIGEQLASIAGQTRKVDEVVICDDAPDELTALAVKKYAGILPLTYVVNSETLGVTGNFNKALSLTTGDIVFLCDQDDVWYPEKIAVMSAMFVPGTVMGVFCDSDITDEKGESLGLTHFESRGYGDLRNVSPGKWQEQLEKSCLRFPAAGHDMAVSKELLTLLLPLPDLTACHDNYLGVAGAALEAWHLVPQSLGIFRRHSSSASGAGSKMSLAGELRAARQSVKDNTFAWNAALFQAVLNRLPALPEEKKALLYRRMEHSKVRAAMDGSFFRRVLPVWREWRAGNYRKFGRGWKNVLQDLFLR